MCLAAIVSCVTRGAARTGPSLNRTALTRYLAEVEPIRLDVNRLLALADPTLKALREHRLSSARAAGRMAALCRRFARYTVDVLSIEPVTPALQSLHRGYAETYVLEDAYLNALVSGLAQDDLADLPNTQSTQRTAIIRWRIGLTVLAGRLKLALPVDLQQAGRGEIAPSPTGS